MNSKILLPALFLLLISFASPLFPDDSVQGTETNFVRYIGPDYPYFPYAIRTSEGSYISISQGETIRKISESGQILWQQRLSTRGASVQYVWFEGIAETIDGYMLAGSTWDWSDIPTGLIVKLGTDGSVQWSKTFQSMENVGFDSVSLTADGGYMIRGYSWTTFGTALLKITAKSDILWSKIFDDMRFSDIVSHPVSDGIILASTNRIFKINDSGSVVWKKSLQINGFQLHSIGPSSDNGVILTGKSSSKVVLVRISSDGNIDWKAAYLFDAPWFDIASVARTSDDGYVISGTKFGDQNRKNPEGFVLKITSKQKLVFRRKFGRSDRDEFVGPIFPTADKGYVIVGLSVAEDYSAEMLFLNVNSNGVVPSCSFFDHLSVQEVASPLVQSNPNLELRSRALALTSGTIEINSIISTSFSSTTCP